MGNPYGGNHLGDLAGALANYRKALQMREKIAKSNPNDIQDQLDLAKNYRTVGWLLYKAGDVSGARKDVHMALEIVKPIAEALNDNVKALNELAVNLLTLAGIEGERWDNGFIGQPAVALTYDLESVKITQKVAEMRPNEKLWQEQTAFMFGVISSDYLAEGKPNEAINYARQALQISNRLKATNAAEAAGIAAQRAARHSTLGQALLFSGRWNEALSEFKNELSLFKKVFDPQDFSSRCDLAIAYMDSGHAEALAGDATSGLRDIRKSLDVLGPSTTMVSTIAQASQAYMYEGDALEQLGNLPAALDSYGKALSQFHSSALAVFPHRSLLVAFGLVSVARVLAKLHKSDEARMNYQEGLHLAETAATTNPPNALAQYVLIDAYAGMGNLSLQTVNTGDQGRNSRSEACKWYQKNMDIWQTLPVRTAITPNGFKVTEYEAIAGQLAKCAQ
jgi:tetratricopeptide (TPR) repeat protein